MKKLFKRGYAAVFTFFVVALCTAQNAIAAVTLPEDVDISNVELMATGLVVGLIGLLAIAWIFKTVRKAS